MKNCILKSFEVNLTRLENGIHHFQFKLVPDFFKTFENNLVKEGFGNASMEMDKSEAIITLNFKIKVNVLLTCYLSLESYRESLICEKNISLNLD